MPDDVVKLKSLRRIAGAYPADIDTIDGFRYISLCYTAFNNDDLTIARIFTLI